ncbi:MAG: hypothetical protein SPL12_03220 [Bacteroidales bacterium]|nr:hypothetical protein [Bacteroidales bacterium]
MKRIAIVAVMVLMSFAATARSVHYFTFSQASRTVSYLNAQNEMMIHCGYDYEIPTYVLVNEVWMERVNSAYYEIWVYGYDAYTGDEIYMPIDLQCVWLYSGNRMYNAAQYLRFHVSVVQPSFTWHIPAYNHYVRVVHRPGYARTYHYHIHRHGWTPPAYTYGPGAPPPPLPYYYLRAPHQPAPMPAGAWTPGVNRPTVPTPATTSTRDNNPTTGRQVQSSHSTGSSSSTNRATNRGSAATPATTRSSSGTATSRTSTATTPTRSTATSRSSGSSTTSGSRSEAARSNTAPTRSAVNSSRSNASSSRSTTSSSRSSATATPATSRSSATRSAATRSAATRSTATESNAKSSTGTVSGSRGTRTTTR